MVRPISGWIVGSAFASVKLSFRAVLLLDIFIHVDAINRNAWQGADDDRPLTPLGHTQAARMADELSAQPVDALYSSPALRCQQSLEPLASKTGLPVVVLPTFQDNSATNAF